MEQAFTRSPVAGMVLVDAYLIPADQADAYIAAREALAERATRVLQAMCSSVERCWAGSQDGEAIVGLDADGEIQALTHLDPDAVDALGELDDEGLRAWFQQQTEAKP